MVIPDISKISLNSLSEKYFSNHYKEFTNYINSKYPDDLKFSEKLYWFFNKIESHPTCIVCGKKVSYRGFIKGYSIYCSCKCTGNSELVKSKSKNTRLEKYGDENFNNREKNKSTCLERYGVTNPFAATCIKNKIKSSLNKKYGVDYAQQSPIIQQVRKNNSLKKYGVDHHMKIKNIKNKVYNNYLKYNINNDDNLIGYTDDGDHIMKCPHLECDKCQDKTYIIPGVNYFSRKMYNIELCTKLLPIKQSHSKGTTIELFIKNILDRHNIKYELNDRNILNNKELDIYIPSKHIAIECNGCFWHSSQNNKPTYYHINKFKSCRDLNIQLLTVWEDWVKNKPNIVESLILSKLNIYNTKIWARKCIVRELDSKTSTNFLNNNHIQGRTNANVRLGLYYKEELVAVMTFSKKSKLSGSKNISGKEFELSRFCNKINTCVVGGASKLLSYFIKTYNPSKITSYCSNDISNGELYKKLGFFEDDKVTPSYWYIHKKELIRYHRTSFTKSRLKEMGYDVENQTESQIMLQLPYWKIYDSGHIKYVLNM